MIAMCFRLTQRTALPGAVYKGVTAGDGGEKMVITKIITGLKKVMT